MSGSTSVACSAAVLVNGSADRRVSWVTAAPPGWAGRADAVAADSPVTASDAEAASASPARCGRAESADNERLPFRKRPDRTAVKEVKTTVCYPGRGHGW